MIKKLDLTDEETARLVLDLEIISYAIEAKMIDYYDIPPLKDTIDSLKVCDEIFYGYYLDNLLVGIISYKIIKDVLDIHRVAINPQFFRRGFAHKLITFVEELNSKISIFTVCTGKDNLPAVNLYLKNDYKKKRDIEVSDEMYITEFEKILY